MKIRLKEDARVLHFAGEVVETSSAYAEILMRLGKAEPAPEEKPEPKKKAVKKKEA